MVRLTRNASRDNNDIGAGEGLLQTIVRGEEALDLSNGRDVGQVGRHAWGVDDIVEGELVDEWGRLEEEGEWLPQTWSVWSWTIGISTSLTCPIPPDAPATTALTILYVRVG